MYLKVNHSQAKLNQPSTTHHMWFGSLWHHLM